MALLLETTWGDLVVDLDIKGSPELCRNILKLAKARYFTSTLVYNVQPNRFCQLGDPRGDGSGGGCIHGLLDGEGPVEKSTSRFLKSHGRVLSSHECQERGRVVATEMNGIPDTIGSQFLITLEEGEGRALDGYIPPHGENEDATRSKYLSLGVVTEDDDNVLEKIHNAYCDANGRPYADIRVERALVIHDPFEDPPGLKELMEQRGVVQDDKGNVTASPSYEHPPEEQVETRILATQVEDVDDEQDVERARQREEEMKKKEDKSRAVVLEMLGDLPSADIKAPEEVLFVCKLNPITEDEDLELIFSRFDPKVKAEIIRDPDTGASLQYAFVEFTNKKACAEAYFKMDGALIDDRRIKVDFSQSVAKVWDKFNQRMRPSANVNFGGGGGGGERGGPPAASRGRGGRGFGGRGGRGGRHYDNRGGAPHREERDRGDRVDRRHENRDRFGGSPREDDRYRGRDEYSRTHDGDREDRHGRHHDYSPRMSDRDDFGRRRRSRSVSPDDRSRDRKSRKHSKKRHRHESRSHRERHHDDDRHRSRRYDSSDEERRRDDSDRHHYRDDERHTSRRSDSFDEDRHRGSHGGDESNRRRRDDGREDRRRHRDDDREEERRHRKHHRRDRDRDDRRRDEHRHKKRKHKERRRRSRSRSASYEDR